MSMGVGVSLGSILPGCVRVRCDRKDYTIDRGQYGAVSSKRAFFINVPTVLLLLGLVGKRNRLFQVGGTNQRPFSDPQNLRNGKTAA